MSTPILYLTAYQSDHTTVLTPLAGAAHSNDFKLASVQGQSGYQPYLDGESVVIRGGRFNPQNGASDVGEATCTVLDFRVGSNSARWLTAYGSLKGVWVQFKESTDGGATKTPIFSGRIVRDSLDPDRVGRRLTVRDQTRDLEAEVFVSRPHDSIGYASRPWLLPLGLQQTYGAIFATSPLSCRVTEQTGTQIRLQSVFDTDNPEVGERLYLSQFLLDIVNAQADNAGVGGVASRFPDYVRCVLNNITSSADSGHFRPVFVTGGPSRVDLVLDELRNPLTGDLLTSDPNYLAAANVDVADEVTIGIFPYREPVSLEAPVILDNVTWPQLWKDLLDGKFGSLNDDGSVVRTWTYSASAFTTLIAEADAPPVRDIITEPIKLFDYISRACQVFGYGWRIDAEGVLIPFRGDIPAEDVSAYPQIVSTDVYTIPTPEWDDEMLDAITGITYVRYLDYERAVSDWVRLGNGPSAPIPGGLIASVEIEDTDPFFADPSLPENHLRVVDRFTRATKRIGGGTSTIEGLTETEWGYRRALARTQVLAGMSRGSTQVVLPGKRTSTINALYPGSWVRVTVPELPDPETGVRGGTRFMLVSERDYDGLARPLRLIDFGFDTQADAPVITNCGQETGNTYNGVECDVALNADDDPVQIQIAVTSQGVGTAPAEDDPAWTFALRLTADVTDRALRNLPSAKRVWIRGRSEPDWTTHFAIKSDWAAGNTHVDTATIAAPTGFTLVMGDVYASATWTSTNSVFELEQLISYIFPVIAYSRLGRLIPGSTSGIWTGLASGVQQGFGVRYIDAYGGVGTSATDSGTTASAPTLDAPTNLQAVVEYPFLVNEEEYLGAVMQLWFQSPTGSPPGVVVGIYKADEDSPGAGTYGAYELAEQVVPVEGDWTKATDGKYYFPAGNGYPVSVFNGQFVYHFLDADIKRRWKCRMETTGGVDLSAYSSVLEVDLTAAAGTPAAPAAFVDPPDFADVIGTLGVTQLPAYLIESGESTPAQWTANQDNFALGAFGTLRISSDASRNLTGITGGAAGRRLTLINIGAQNIVVVNDATSTAANRFLTGTGADITMVPLDIVELKYDGTSTRWRVVSHS